MFAASETLIIKYVDERFRTVTVIDMRVTYGVNLETG